VKLMQRFGRFIFVLLVVEFLLAFAFGLWLQRRVAGDVFLGSLASPRPGHVLHAGAVVLEPREHEEQVRQAIHIT
jgi:hypothetical protein